MARAAAAVGEWGGRISRRLLGIGLGGFSYKKITIAVCSLNLLVALFVLKSLYSSFADLPNRHTPFSAVKYTEEQIRRIEEAVRVRQAAEPVELANLVKQLRKELGGKKRRWELSVSVKEEMANELLGRLRGLNEIEQREPMLTIGSTNPVIWADNWTAVTEDGSLSAQFEHALLIIEDGAEILTQC